MELFRALGSLVEPPAPEHRRVAEALALPPVPDAVEHHAVVRSQRYPYASVYLGPEGMMGGVARGRVAGFWRALGRGRESWKGAPDHLASLLALLAELGEGEDGEAEADRVLRVHARDALMWECVSPWLGVYLATFRGSGSEYYEAWAETLGNAIRRVEAEIDVPSRLPVPLAKAPGLADPRVDGGAAFLASLLAPARAGVVVLRDDLVRLAADAGLACRAGERRYALESLLGQDAPAALEWLSGHAARWRRAVRGPEPIARWWGERARKTSRLLGELAAEAAAARPGTRASAPAP